MSVVEQSWNKRVADAAQVCAELENAALAADDDEAAQILGAAVDVLDRQLRVLDGGFNA
jgi:hypothetical protein